MPIIKIPYAKAEFDALIKEFLPCDHPVLEMRMERDPKGVRRVYRQCPNCGDKRGEVAWRKLGIDPDSLPPFDAQFLELRRALKGMSYGIARARYSALRNETWWKAYRAHLDSPEWKRKRAMVFARSNFQCERGECMNRAEQVHHLTYERLGEEPLEDLQAVCIACHRQLHPDRLFG